MSRETDLPRLAGMIDGEGHTIVFKQETLAQCLDDHTKALLQMHWSEVAPDQDLPLDPNYDTYYKLEEMGALRIFVLRQEGLVQGYAVFFVLPNMKYQTSLHATADLLYLVPWLRKQMLGARFLSWVDDQLRKEGVQIVRHSVERTYDFGPLLERLGYEQRHVVYEKRLDRG
jgi:hypothetical protein